MNVVQTESGWAVVQDGRTIREHAGRLRTGRVKAFTMEGEMSEFEVPSSLGLGDGWPEWSAEECLRRAGV